ncbi:MAG: S-layer homology domain-containing protein [Peptococcaceae bacterium]|nr:S-layer homology domain-containing protein [Peptococcaceae bacterium]
MLKKTTKRFISIVMAIAMILTMVPFAAFADETTASDLSGHWAENVITEWMDYGIINGYEDGTIRPNNKITRAEMTAMLDRVMDYQTKADNTFSDLSDSWYTDVILKANAAGVISGYPDGTVKPDATITRQEAVAMFSRVLSLDTENAPEATFTDNADVADWAKDAVNAMAAADYIHGSDGQFRPNDGITRAEVVTILNNIFDKLYQKAGEYTGNVDGSAVINTDQVTLKDMTISGDLIIAEGVGDGHVVLDNVTVDGKLIVRGGGENSVIIKGDSKIDNISVERIDGAVRVAVEDNANVNAVLIDNGGQNVKLEGTVNTVNVAAANVNVDITGAAKDINVAEEAHDATITLTSTATADKVSTSAENTTIIVAGTVSSIDIADSANNSVVTTQSSATVDKVTTAAGNTTIEGSGTVTDVVVSESASDATVTTEGTKVENNSSSNVTTSDDSVIAPGTTDTTPGGTTDTPSVPSTPSTPHSHSYVDGVCSCGAYDPAWAQVNSTATWNAAVEAGKNIVVTADFTTNAQLQITKAITVNGNGHTISAADGWTGTANDNKHLLSIIGDDANNVAIKNLTLDSKNAAYGAQAYCVEGTTLTNVTLQNSKGAGLTVNGSTVTANGLTTSGNAWGGVNIDKGTGVTDNTTFTFDANSTFTEASPVYSDDATQVTVTAPEGWAKAATPGEDSKNPNKCTWYKLFAGGNGTADNPYLISTAEQLANIDKLSNQMKNNQLFNFKLTNNIDYTSSTTYINNFCGVLDGNNHDIRMSESTGNVLMYNINGEVVIKNLNYVQTAPVLAMLTAYDYADKITFENITFKSDAPAGTHHEVCTYGASQFGMNISGKITFKNCVNEVDYTIPGDTSSYAGIFIGNYISSKTPSTVSYINCVNKGNISGNQIGFFFGNSAQASGASSNGIKLVDSPDFINDNKDQAAIYVNNCRNEGLINATVKCEPFLSVNTTTVNNSVNETLLAQSEKFYVSPNSMVVSSLNDMELNLSADKSVKITPSSNENVASYLLRYTVSTGYTNNDGESIGSWYFSIAEPVSASEANSKSFAYITKIMLDTEYDKIANDGQKYDDLAKQGNTVKEDANGNEYILIDLPDGSKAAVIDSSQATENYDGAANMTCGTIPTYTLMAIDNSNHYLGSITYQNATIPSVVLN